MGSSTVRMAVLGFVEVVDHAGQGGRFTGTGGARDQYQTTRLQGQILEHLGGIELLERQDFGGNGPEYGARPRFWLKALTRKRARP